MMRKYSGHLRVVLASGSLLIALGAQVQAADEGSAGGWLQQLFGSSTQPVQQVAPAVGPSPPGSEPTYAYRPARRSVPAKLRPRTRYVALPQSEALELRITDRQTPIDMSQGATAALLKDDTLRPGDIVVMSDGARVFAGEPGKPHKMRDFARPEQSRLVDRKTRNLLAAMMVPMGAMSAGDARKAMANARECRLPEATSVQASASPLRVIYPWMIRR